METLSSLDESSSSDTKSNSTFQLPPQSTTSAMKPPPKAEVRILCRMGSGTTSVVIDADASGSEADSTTNILTTNINFNNNNNHKLPSSKYKGVVPQPNGRWGAQIYDKHQRVWLGTFDKEAEAAHVYDVAVHRYRGGDGVTNFNPLSDPEELQFLASRSKAEVVDMLRKHTYHDELLDSRRNTAVHQSHDDKDKPHKAFLRALFEKVVTPSDVGKLNRLVIPKQQAERHFPRTARGQKGRLACSPKGVLLSFEDARTDKVWRFRYSYWNSSRSYVLTRGWSRFVKEHSLKAGDTVSFQRSTIPDNTHQLYIQCKTAARNTAAAEVLQSQCAPVKMLRLFGVDICAGHAIQH